MPYFAAVFKSTLLKPANASDQLDTTGSSCAVLLRFCSDIGVYEGAQHRSPLPGEAVLATRPVFKYSTSISGNYSLVQSKDSVVALGIKIKFHNVFPPRFAVILLFPLTGITILHC